VEDQQESDVLVSLPFGRLGRVFTVINRFMIPITKTDLPPRRRATSRRSATATPDTFEAGPASVL
jgi:hypothetical protein